MLPSLIFYYTIFFFFSFLFYFQPTTTMSSNFFAAQICDVWTFKKVRERVGKSIWIQGQCLKVKNWTVWNMSLLFPDPASESTTLIRNCSKKFVKVGHKTTYAHGSYEWIIMLEKCVRLDLTVFHLIWVIGTYGNWKNQNPGSLFGATS